MPSTAPAAPRRTARPSDALARALAAALDDAKAQDVTILRVGDVTDLADWFVVATGTSNTHVRSTAGKLVEAAQAAGHRVHHVEGAEAGQWVVLDFVDVIVHLFVPALRTYYQLERLWSDAPVVPAARLAS
ncbi:MAG: ribosome silencing factor [Gemmatimonadota bacterium]|jgi:ribosome-associated protein|nr:ribosome silencing factor [Gemmatimonadota bacterium]